MYLFVYGSLSLCFFLSYQTFALTVSFAVALLAPLFVLSEFLFEIVTQT